MKFADRSYRDFFGPLKKHLIPLHPPLSKGGNLSPPFGKGRWPACATYLRPPKRGLRVGGSRFGEGRGGI